MRLHFYDGRDVKCACKAWAGGLHCSVIQNVRKYFLHSEPTKPRIPVIGKAVEVILRATCEQNKKVCDK